ncbi:MAG TPA: CYTH domain-containing protein [Halothiobacillaceae bacterium]|nr:CYTH domain-containing protein [Halothiobacillaceae bacterium]
MAKEIERKFLVTNDHWRDQIKSSHRMVQGYLNDAGRASVRVRISGDQAWLNIKSRILGVERDEYEYPIPVTDARQMLDTLADGALIEKTRHLVDVAGLTWEIDEFYGDNAGLIVAEVELYQPDATFHKPDWAGKEVTDDPRYYNVALVRHPFSTW